jgi:hypothetical protein
MLGLARTSHCNQVVRYRNDRQQKHNQQKESDEGLSCLPVTARIRGSRPMKDQQKREYKPEKIEKKLHAPSV